MISHRNSFLKLFLLSNNLKLILASGETQPQTENMEVHAHTHTPRKKWTHYFWEFLMLFLAVFCGFLAEYQLEHTIEHQREAQYMQTLLEDLHNDTTGIEEAYKVGVAQKEAMDSVVNFINTQTISGGNVRMLYQLLPNTGRVVTVKFENRTSSQLKNAGGMRIVRKKDVADSIVRYWQLIEACNDISDRLERTSESRVNVGSRLFDNKYFIRNNVPFKPITGIKENAVLISNDPALLAEYANRTYGASIVLNNYLFNLKLAKRRAVSLMSALKQRYHLK